MNGQAQSQLRIWLLLGAALLALAAGAVAWIVVALLLKDTV
jgi:hypothetical protein